MAKYYVQVADAEYALDVIQTHEGTLLRLLTPQGQAAAHVDFAPVHSSPETGEGLYSIIVDGKSYQLYVAEADEGYRVAIGRHRIEVRVLTEREWRLEKVAPRRTAHTGELTVKAPMPGLVKSVQAAAGDEVKTGQRLLVLEAMKMENDINAPRDGRVLKVHVEPSTVVEGGRPLVTLE